LHWIHGAFSVGSIIFWGLFTLGNGRIVNSEYLSEWQWMYTIDEFQKFPLIFVSLFVFLTLGNFTSFQYMKKVMNKSRDECQVFLEEYSQSKVKLFQRAVDCWYKWCLDVVYR